MADTQLFRLKGATEIMRIPTEQVDGQNLINWGSIEKVFPGVKRVKNGKDAIPRYIKYFPGTVLDVELTSTPEGHIRVDSSAAAPSLVPTIAINVALTNGHIDAHADAPADSSGHPSNEDNVVKGLRVTSALAEMPKGVNNGVNYVLSSDASISRQTSRFKIKTASKTTPSFVDVVKRASEIAKETNGVQQKELIQEQQAKDHHEEIMKLQMALAARQEKMEQLQKQTIDQQEELKQLAIDHHEEIKQLQINTLGQLAVLQSRVQAIFTQIYELHEYTIPRLFVFLPQDPSSWDAINPLSNKFRLHFLCECGEHTKSNSSRAEISHEIHFAKHEGYVINRPSQFFTQYGHYVLTIINMLKFGITVAGVVVPPISHLVSSDAIDQVADDIKKMKDFEPGMDHIINWMDKVSTDEGEPVDESARQMKPKEALEGDELRKLYNFLKDKDENKTLGNLYKTVTDEGNVKWVCIDHFRHTYQENAAREFQRLLDSVGGSFNENTGKVEVRLRSKVLAEAFFAALVKARSVLELDIDFDWACTTSDLEALEDTLKKTRVSILRLDLGQFRPGVASILLAVSTQYDVIFRIKDLPNMTMLHILLSGEQIKFLGISPKKSAHGCKMYCELAPGSIGKREFEMMAEALKTNLTLTTLSFENISTRAITKSATLSGITTNTSTVVTTTTVPGQPTKITTTTSKAKSTQLLRNLIEDNKAQALANALKINSTLKTLILKGNKITSIGAQMLAEALNSKSTLSTLDLTANSIKHDGAKALAEALKTNKTLITLNLDGNEITSIGAQALAEALETNSTVSISS
ncbi:hypothetical protein BGZ94_008031 [Podila epigama]|nr:hypothetical protein BGZ94_008031 [Podila epigama]